MVHREEIVLDKDTLVETEEFEESTEHIGRGSDDLDSVGSFRDLPGKMNLKDLEA